MNTILEARDRCANDASLRHLGEALSAAIDAHGACVEKDSATSGPSDDTCANISTCVVDPARPASQWH